MNPNTPGMPADANTYSVSNGILSMGIKNTPSDVPGSLVNNQPFLSSEINTKNEFSQTYGYFEVRMQTEAVTGTSVAFWAIPQNGSWPPEVDMPEIEGQWPSYINWGMHSGPNNTTPQLWDYNAPNTSAGMNVFAVDWEPNTVTFYLNGKVEYQEPTPSDWNTPMYLILDSLANAPGSWDGSPPSTINAALKVDYVRAYNSNPYVNGVTNPDWTNHGTTATAYTPVVDASGNLTGFSNGAPPPTFKPSPDNTVITAAQAAQGASITDASGNVWSIASNGQVSVNGTPDGQSGGVTELAYEKGLIWQENSAGMWWSKSKPSDTWGPTYGTATSPVPPAAWQDLSLNVPTAAASAVAGKPAPISGLSITDPWAATASGTMTLKVSDKAGSITIGGQTFGAAGGTLTGTEAQLNTDLAGLTYSATAAGADTLSLDVTESGRGGGDENRRHQHRRGSGRHPRQARGGALGRRLSRQCAVHREDGRQAAWRGAVGHGSAQHWPDADLHLLRDLGRRRAQRGDRLPQRRLRWRRQGPQPLRQPGHLRRPRRDEPDGTAARQRWRHYPRRPIRPNSAGQRTEFSRPLPRSDARTRFPRW